jgi:hypothetical protein
MAGWLLLPGLRISLLEKVTVFKHFLLLLLTSSLNSPLTKPFAFVTCSVLLQMFPFNLNCHCSFDSLFFFRFSDEREDVQKKTFGKWINSQLIKVRGVLYISSWIMTLKNKKSIHLLDQFFIGDGLVLRSPRWNAITSLTECVDWSNLCEYTTHFC